MFANRMFASAVGLIPFLAAAPGSFHSDGTVVTKVLAAPASRQLPPQREHFPHADVLYDWVINDRGENVRTFISRPKNVCGKVPAIVFVGWLSCDTMESPDPKPDDGFGILLGRLIDQSGFATVRMDKPGVGETKVIVRKLISKAR